MKKVIIINGAPGSGKSHYVNERAKAGDIVLDLDRINEAISPGSGLYQDAEPVLAVSLEMRKAFLAAIKERLGKWNTAYVISSTPQKAALDELAESLGAEVVSMPVSLETCISNIAGDDRRTDKDAHIQRAVKWYEEHDSGDHEAEPEEETPPARDPWKEFVANFSMDAFM